MMFLSMNFKKTLKVKHGFAKQRDGLGFRFATLAGLCRAVKVG
ncbi:hypothetical protein [Campylobacter upsaliensis]|nr:hypothetical protein [Campylobacter upsaliensis]MCR2099700.1 hypothetical protein [Campylobacter upsaliensis]